jgi:uncharacterized paraquat-inducible protein A
MFDVIFFAVIVAIAFIVCAIAEVIAYRIIKQNKASREYSDNNVCDACGQNPKAPDSQICKECQKKAYDD